MDHFLGRGNFEHLLLILGILGGQLAAGLTLSRSTISSRGDSIQGFLSNVSYFRRVRAWNFKGSFNYSQDVQTFLIAHTTSGYSYSGSAGRCFWAWQRVIPSVFCSGVD